MSHLLCSPPSFLPPNCVSVHVLVRACTCTCVHAPSHQPDQLPSPLLPRRSRGGGSPPAQTNSALSLKAMIWCRQATESRRGLQVNETKGELVWGIDSFHIFGQLRDLKKKFRTKKIISIKFNGIIQITVFPGI